MTKYIFHVHSFIDLITNSSSELYVCNGIKSIGLLKQIAESIIGDWSFYFSEPDFITAKDIEEYEFENNWLGAIMFQGERDLLPEKLQSKLINLLQLEQIW